MIGVIGLGERWVEEGESDLGELEKLQFLAKGA